MLVHILKSKIHRGSVTAANLNYEGSMTIDADLMDRAGLLPYEKILCSNMANAARFETYAIPGQRGLGEIVLNGARSTARRRRVQHRSRTGGTPCHLAGEWQTIRRAEATGEPRKSGGTCPARK